MDTFICWKISHHYSAVWDMAYSKIASGSQIVYLPRAFFAISIVTSEAELWSNNSGASLGLDSLIVDWNNWLMAWLKDLTVTKFVKFLITQAKIHLGQVQKQLWKVKGNFRIRYPHSKVLNQYAPKSALCYLNHSDLSNLVPGSLLSWWEWKIFCWGAIQELSPSFSVLS